jgi:hypothetical protein
VKVLLFIKIFPFKKAFAIGVFKAGFGIFRGISTLFMHSKLSSNLFPQATGFKMLF